ncbi:UNVERIFIED_CONTAM: hypothetical protein HDU68_003667, partial [Siphonaria sp. JEL0065]
MKELVYDSLGDLSGQQITIISIAVLFTICWAMLLSCCFHEHREERGERHALEMSRNGYMRVPTQEHLHLILTLTSRSSLIEQAKLPSSPFDWSVQQVCEWIEKILPDTDGVVKAVL